jgi:hypothetical protein
MDSARDTLAGGLPHSEIPGSTIARISPGLFAACHVLHRLSVPRHPPDALTLRLSATPNGKDHPDIGKQISKVGTDRPPRGVAAQRPSARRKIVPPGQTLLLGRHFIAGTRAAPPDKPKGRPQLPLRSHNSLLYDCQSAIPHRIPNGNAAKVNSGLLAALPETKILISDLCLPTSDQWR